MSAQPTGLAVDGDLKPTGPAAEAGGPDLNLETFRAALDDLSEFHIPGSGPATLDDGKYDAEDNLRVPIYDVAEEALVPLED